MQECITVLWYWDLTAHQDVQVKKQSKTRQNMIKTQHIKPFGKKTKNYYFLFWSFMGFSHFQWQTKDFFLFIISVLKASILKAFCGYQWEKTVKSWIKQFKLLSTKITYEFFLTYIQLLLSVHQIFCWDVEKWVLIFKPDADLSKYSSSS